MDEGKVSFARSGDDLALRFEGAIRYPLAHGLDQFLDRTFTECPPKTVCIDLNTTQSIDSTGIGLLAKITRLLGVAGGGKPVIFSTNGEINELLRALCLDRYCLMVAGAAQMTTDDVVPKIEPDEAGLRQTILDAHRTLCELSTDNRQQFQSVVDALTGD